MISRGRVRVRVIRTPLAEDLIEKPSDKGLNFLSGSREEAWVKGDLKAYALPSGQITGMIKEVRSVREIIEEMVS